jgi:hypothetical protein
VVDKTFMCRNIKTLHNFEPPATQEEIHASSLQFVRKLSGFSKPSKANEEVFNRAVEQVNLAATELIRSLVSNAPPRDREIEAAKRKRERRNDTASRIESTKRLRRNLARGQRPLWKSSNPKSREPAA